MRIIKTEFETEKHEIEKSHNEERRELRDMIITIEEEEDQKLREMNEANENLREEIKNKNMEDLEGMKHELIRKIDDLDKNFEHNFTRYMQETESKSASYREMLR